MDASANEVAFARVPPGRYWMQVNVMDASANEVAFARVPLAIISAPGKSATPAGGQQEQRPASPGAGGG